MSNFVSSAFFWFVILETLMVPCVNLLGILYNSYSGYSNFGLAVLHLHDEIEFFFVICNYYPGNYESMNVDHGHSFPQY